MKRCIPIFCLLFIFSLISRADFIFSELHLKLYDNTPFTIIIDNQPYSNPSNNFLLKNLLPGKHFLQVERSTGPYGSSCGAAGVFIFSGLITIPYNSRIYAYIDPRSMYNVINLVPLYNTQVH